MLITQSLGRIENRVGHVLAKGIERGIQMNPGEWRSWSHEEEGGLKSQINNNMQTSWHGTGR